MQITIRLHDENGEKIVLIAAKMALEQSDVVRLALNRFVEKEVGERPKSPYDRVKHLIGVTESGIPDLGQRHRDYLNGHRGLRSDD